MIFLNNSSLRGSHKWFSYIHNLKIIELFRSRRHFGVNYRTINPASLAAIKSFTFQRGKQHFQTFWLQVEVLCCLPTLCFRKHDGWKGQGRRSKGHHLQPPQRFRLSKFSSKQFAFFLYNNFTCKLWAWVIFIILLSYWITVYQDALGAYTSASWLWINYECRGSKKWYFSGYPSTQILLLFSFRVTSECNFETFLSVTNPLLCAPPKQ